MKKLTICMGAIYVGLMAVTLGFAVGASAVMGQTTSETFNGVVTVVTGDVVTIVFNSPNQIKACEGKASDPNCVVTIMDVPRGLWFSEWGRFPTRVGTHLKARWEGRSLIPVKSGKARRSSIRAQTMEPVCPGCHPCETAHSYANGLEVNRNCQTESNEVLEARRNAKHKLTKHEPRYRRGQARKVS